MRAESGRLSIDSHVASVTAGTRAIEQLIAQGQAEMVLARHRASNVLGPPVAVLICWVLWDDVAHAWLLAWLGLKLLVSLWRAAITSMYDRGGRVDALRWCRRFDAALVADGATYGLLGTVLMPAHNPALAAIMVATLLGIAALGLVVLAMRIQSSLALTLPILLPGIVYQLSLGERTGMYIAAGMCVFLILVVWEGGKASAHTRDMLRLRYQMDEVASQRAQALELAERNSAVKDRFLATMSHEMRTPLHGILGLARMLQSAPADTAGARNSLAVLERTGEHLLGVINDVLDFSKIQSGHLRLAPQPFELCALVQSVADVSLIAAHEKGLWQRLDLQASAPCWVEGDATRLRQVLLNLLGNAVKFTGSGGVSLTVRREAGESWVFEVCDTGVGVPEAQREAVFEAFTQADPSDGRRHGGTGLGLTISRELARAMGGELQCLPPQGPGSVFRLAVPLRDAQPPLQPARSDELPRLSGQVLLVEDNPVNAMVAEAALRRLGLEVEVVVDGEAACASTLQRRPDLILMDCQMPGMDGFEATRRIRARERETHQIAVPIVALTANAMEGDRERSLAAGMDDHLSKPFRDEDLLVLLRRFLQQG